MRLNEKAKKEMVYLTKRLLSKLATKAVDKTAKDAIKEMGYVIEANEGRVVKRYADGRVEKIEPIENA